MDIETDTRDMMKRIITVINKIEPPFSSLIDSKGFPIFNARSPSKSQTKIEKPIPLTKGNKMYFQDNNAFSIMMIIINVLFLQ